jgi:hypothetical protein
MKAWLRRNSDKFANGSALSAAGLAIVIGSIAAAVDSTTAAVLFLRASI